MTPNQPEPGPEASPAGYPVLYVDDEPANLLTFRFSLEHEFRILTAGSGEEALEILAAEPVAVLLADHRMEGISGTELCARARTTQPRAIRMIVTAYGDLSVAMEAINQAQVERFIVKPWDAPEMIAILHKAIETFQQQSQADLPAIDRAIQRLVEPATALQHNLEWSVEKLGGLEAALKASPRPVADTYRRLSSALQDSREAAAELSDAVREALRAK
jgi:response regulator RpfG family c-di-GMP phosphodiesterase